MLYRFYKFYTARYGSGEQAGKQPHANPRNIGGGLIVARAFHSNPIPLKPLSAINQSARKSVGGSGLRGNQRQIWPWCLGQIIVRFSYDVLPTLAILELGRLNLGHR